MAHNSNQLMLINVNYYGLCGILLIMLSQRQQKQEFSFLIMYSYNVGLQSRWKWSQAVSQAAKVILVVRRISHMMLLGLIYFELCLYSVPAI